MTWEYRSICTLNGGSRMLVPIGIKTKRQTDQDVINPSLEYMMGEASIDPAQFNGSAREVRAAIQRAKRERSDRLGLGYERFTNGQFTDSWATGIFPNVQIGLHPEGAFLMRFMPHPTDPEIVLLRHHDPGPSGGRPKLFGAGLDGPTRGYGYLRRYQAGYRVHKPSVSHRISVKSWTRILNCCPSCKKASVRRVLTVPCGVSRSNACGIFTRS